MNHEIIKATETDFKILSELCHEIYPQTYSNWWHDEGKWYMETMYNPDIMLVELKDEYTEFHFLIIDQKPQGYLKLNHFFKKESGSFEIERIYLDQTFAGQGFGSLMLNFAIELARSMSKKTVFLKVMASGTGLIEFYEKHGFQTIGCETLPFELLKSELRTINTMKKVL